MPPSMQVFARTFTELLDSKKWIGSYVATAIAVCLIQFLHWSPEVAMLVVTPIGLAVASQAHVDAAAQKAQGPGKVEAPVQTVNVDTKPVEPAA